MSDAALDVPDGLDLAIGPRGLRLIGPQPLIVVTVEQFRQLKDLPEGSTVQLGDWTLVVSAFLPDSLPPKTVSMPGHAWNIAASILRDVAYGEYSNPMDFSEVGFLAPAPPVDIGVEVIGPIDMAWRP